MDCIRLEAVVMRDMNENRQSPFLLFIFFGPREPLRAGRQVLDLLGLAQGIHRFVDGQEDCRFKRPKRTTATNCQRNRGHGHVVGGLP